MLSLNFSKIRKILPLVILIAAPVWVILSLVLSVVYGAKNIEVETIINAFFHYDANDINHEIILSSRMPRAIGALLIGAFLAISGSIMQGITRNPLASPSIMGVSDGSVFMITMCMIFLPNASSIELILFSFLGSALGVAVVFGIASILPNGFSPVRLALLGTIIGTFLSSLATGFASFFQISQSISFWYNSRLDQMDPQLIKISLPFAVVAIIAAIWLSKSITILSLGDEMSTNLGQRTTIIKIVASVVVMVLTGVSVALAGKIAFIGLIIPHITRFLVGSDYKWIIPCSGVLGAVFLTLSDVLARFINYPFETPVGVIMAFIGVPFFLYLARTRGGKSYV
ncbi:iron ABC transporter permease [Bacillus cereus group sp. BfR-BA-01310]|uniref:FecCD family ABC transporter permease n=1 Tax=Bacillus cereus group sp. BfR-BA-01310 TaxID=2920287 RepID=UPI001F58307D|nr:iron ABC transporter permease [Bacillus cereus group sp. BfR-BA-01310]